MRRLNCVVIIQSFRYVIRKTCPCNVYPLEPHFYIAKLGYAGVYLFFLFLLQNIDCEYLLKPPQLIFFQFLKLKKSLFIAWASFRNVVAITNRQRTQGVKTAWKFGKYIEGVNLSEN